VIREHVPEEGMGANVTPFTSSVCHFRHAHREVGPIEGRMSGAPGLPR
jgi:hypothetical protein